MFESNGELESDSGVRRFEQIVEVVKELYDARMWQSELEMEQKF